MLNKKPPVIMQILPALNSGGIERGVIDISKAVAAHGWTSIVASNGGAMISQFNSSKVKHVTLALHSKNPFTIYRNIGRLVKIIKEYQVDLIHIRSRAPGWSAYFAYKRIIKRSASEIKIISTVHGSYSLTLLSKKISRWKLKYNAVMLKPQSIIAVSNFIKDYIIKNYSGLVNLAEKQIKVIHRGVDLNYFCVQKVAPLRIIQLIKEWDLPDDKQIIMLPGRITSWKGQEFLIDALAKVKNQNFFCILVGSTLGHKKYCQRLEKKIKENNLEGKIKIVGTTKDMPAAYLVSDLVISASVKPEAFGRVAIEAGAMGRVVIATNIGGSLETIVDGQTGFLVEVNDVEKLAQKIDQVLVMDKTTKDQISQNAVKHISQNFSNQKMLEQTIQFYQQILGL